jgi:hypothetical protein
VVIHVSQAAVDVHTKYGRYDVFDKLEVFYKGSSEYLNLIVSKNSPLGPILQHGSKIMFERGVFDYLNAKWLGKEKQTGMARSVSSSEKTILNINHVLFAFGIYGSLVAACIVVLCGETCVKHQHFFIAKSKSALPLLAAKLKIGRTLEENQLNQREEKKWNLDVFFDYLFGTNKSD